MKPWGLSSLNPHPSTAAPLHLIKLCFKMACLIGIAQASLALLSLRCTIARQNKTFYSAKVPQKALSRICHTLVTLLSRICHTLCSA